MAEGPDGRATKGPRPSGPADDFFRLWQGISRAALPAIGLAFLSTFGLLVLAYFTGGGIIGFALPALFLWFHGIFIAVIPWKLVKPRRPLLSAILHPGLVAGAVLAVPILFFAGLGLAGSSYSCADGLAYGRSGVPNLPWLWIGWAFPALTALPARAVGLAMKQQPPLIPAWRRAVLMIPFLPVLWFFGTPFEWREVDCTPPFGGWGLFEGGMVLIPLVGLFWFLMSFSLAVLSYAGIDPAATEGPAEGKACQDGGET